MPRNSPNIKEALEARGERNILMWLVAPHIPSSVREFLDRLGIEYSEIHDVQLRRVAERHGITIESSHKEPALARPSRAAHVPEQKEVAEMPPDGYRLLGVIDKQELAELISEFERAAKRRIDRSLAKKLRKQLLDAEPPSLDHMTVLQLARWCKTQNPLYRTGMGVARKISTALFGVVLDRERLGT